MECSYSTGMAGNSGEFDPVRERARLARLCHRWTGDANAAEDLAQETLLIALRRWSRGATPEAWSPYLWGIARRLCQRWRERSQKAEAQETAWDTLPELPTPVMDPLEHLLQSEREALVERALGYLKEPMRALLADRYLADLPLNELAARRGLTENAAAARLHRSREALHRTLVTQLREDAAAHGLLDDETANGWRTTAIPCCRCGTVSMAGRFTPTNRRTGEPPYFELRCPRCPGNLIGMSSNAAPMDRAAVLEGVTGFRAGLNRVNRWWQGYIAGALASGNAACPDCGRPATASTQPNEEPGLIIRCPHCARATFFIAPVGLLYHSDAFQNFWRRYPRMQNQPPQALICENRPAVLTTFKDRLTSASVEMIFDAETLRVLRVETLVRQ